MAKVCNFTVSKKNKQVLDILDKVKNKSEFICQAVIEKYNRSASNNVDRETLRKEIKSILEEMIADDYFIVKGNIKNIEAIDSITSPPEENKEENCKEAEEINDDLENTLKQITADW